MGVHIGHVVAAARPADTIASGPARKVTGARFWDGALKITLAVCVLASGAPAGGPGDCGREAIAGFFGTVRGRAFSFGGPAILIGTANQVYAEYGFAAMSSKTGRACNNSSWVA